MENYKHFYKVGRCLIASSEAAIEINCNDSANVTDIHFSNTANTLVIQESDYHS